MRKFTAILFCLVLLGTGSASAAGAPAVPDTWSASLQQSTREMVRAGVPADDAIAMTSSMVQARFNRQQIQQAQQVVVKAHQKGLPVAPVISKALEGVAKQVPPRSVIRAMERVSSRYAYAFNMASRLTREKPEIERLGQLIAASLAAGMSHRDMAKMVGRLHNEVRHLSRDDRRALAAAALVTARDMARQGVPSAHAAQVVDRALHRGFKAHEMQALHHAFMSRSAAMPADQVALSFSRSIHRGTFDAMAEMAEHVGKTAAASMAMEAEHGVIGHATTGNMGHADKGPSGHVSDGGDMGGHASGDMGGHSGDMGGHSGVDGGSSGGDVGGHGDAAGGGSSGGDASSSGGDMGGHASGDMGGHGGGDMGGHGGGGGSDGGGHH